MQTVSKPVVVRPPKQFDLAKFETMVEPFAVRIEKVKGSMKYEIPMPQISDGASAPGTGLSKDQVRDLQTWLVNEWAGGGHYNLAITDASVPAQLMEWTAYYPIHEFPEKVPPTLQAAFQLNPAALPQPQAKQNMASLPPASLYPTFVQPGAVPVPQPQGYYQPVPYGYSTPMQQAPQQQANAELSMLREQLARAREEAQARDFERRLAEMKGETERQAQAMQASMASMIQQLTQTMQAQQKPAVDPVLEQMREQLRAAQEQARVQQVESERMRRESELREEIRRTQEATAKLVEESNRRFEAMMAASANKGPDAQVMMFQQMFASQTEAMKEMARASQSQLDRVQNFMMRPQDMLAIAKEGSSNTDHVVANLTRQFEQMFQMSRALTEQAAQLNSGGGGNEVIGLVRDVGTNLAEMAKKYTGDKSKEAVAQMSAQAEVARAQAEVQKAQFAQMSHMASMEAAMKNGQAVPLPNGSYAAPPAAPQQAIAAPTVNGRPWATPKTPRTEASNGLNGAPAPTGAPINGQTGQLVPFKQGDDVRRVKGRTDMEWFGPILPNVELLRTEVAKFIHGLSQVPPVKDGADPSDSAMAIQAAAAEIMQRQIPIPAMIDLLLQGMVADFLDVLLPDAPQAYRDDVTKILMNNEDEEPEDDDDDDADQVSA